MTPFYHIVDRDEWAAAVAAGTYTTASLATEGFIHCSYPSQILVPANERFRGRHNLILLKIDPEKVEAEVRHDPVDVESNGILRHEHFPHIYGPLNPDAVVATIPFPPTPDGSFTLPAELAE